MARFTGSAVLKYASLLSVALYFAPAGCASTASQALSPVPPVPMTGPGQSLVAKGWTPVDQEHGRVARTRTWKLSGAPVQEAGMTLVQDPLIQQASEASGQQAALSVQSSEQLRCYAREQAAFWGAHQAGPSEAIERYMAAACGVWGYRPYVFHKRISGENASQLRASLREALGTFPAAGVFAAAQRSDLEQSSWLTVVYDATPFRWKPIPVSVPGRGQFELSAKPLIDASFDDGMVTDGLYGWKQCSASSRDQAQMTRLRCRYNGDDALSFVNASNIIGQEKSEGPLFRVGVFGSGGVVTSYSEGEGYPSRVKGPMSDPAKLLMVLNETRRRAGMPRINSDAQLGLRIDEWWRKPNAQAVKTAFFERSGAYHAAGTDQGAAGMQLVIASFILPKGLSSSEAMERALILPQARAVLLSSQIRRIAIRQYDLEGRDAIETMVAAYIR